MMNNDNVVYPSQFTERWWECLGLPKVYSIYVCISNLEITPLDFAMDVLKRNFACYIRHDTFPNVFVQLVRHDQNNMSFLCLMLFAMKNIPLLKELSLDYGVRWN